MVTIRPRGKVAASPPSDSFLSSSQSVGASGRGGRRCTLLAIRERDHMKILIASTPATGHLNPLLAIGRILIAEGHEVVGLTGTALRDRIEGIGAEFRPFPAGADLDLRDVMSVAPELKDIPPGPEWSRVAFERVFADPALAQHKGLQQVLRGCAADAIIGDDMIFGVLRMLLGPRAKRPAIVL